MRSIALALFSAFGLLLASPALGQTRLPEDEQGFAEAILVKMRKLYPGATLSQADGEPLQINVSGGAMDGALVNLHRIFAFCQQVQAEECSEVAEEFLARISQPSREPQVENLRVLIRDSQYVDYVRQNLPGDVMLAQRQIGDDLFALLAIDSPDTIALANVDMLEEFGIDVDEAWQRALVQTRAITPPLPEGDAVMGQLHVFTEYEYLPSLLYPADGWTEIAQKVGPDLFVATINDGLVLAGTVSDTDLPDLQGMVADECAASARCVSPNVYRWRNGFWTIAKR